MYLWSRKTERMRRDGDIFNLRTPAIVSVSNESLPEKIVRWMVAVALGAERKKQSGKSLIFNRRLLLIVSSGRESSAAFFRNRDVH